jgi:hypothetical protein
MKKCAIMPLGAEKKFIYNISYIAPLGGEDAEHPYRGNI